MEPVGDDRCDSDSNDSSDFVTPTALAAPSECPDPDYRPGTPVHSELTSSTNLSLQDTWKVQRAESELRKCLGKDSTEPLLKSYSCAWQRDILIHGRMYVTPKWFCFYSNILGWETKTSIRCTDVTSITKQKTALVFPNAILIEVGHKKYGFGSVVYRDKVYHVLVTVWKNALSPTPLPEISLIEKINDWKHHTKDSTPSNENAISKCDSFSSDLETTHTHHALATSTKHTLDTCDSDSNESTHGFDHIDSALINTGRMNAGRGSSCSSRTTSSESGESGSSRSTGSSSSSDQHIDDVPLSIASTSCRSLKRDSSNVLSEQYTTNDKTGLGKQCKQQLAAIRYLRKLCLLKQFTLTRRCTSSTIINMLLIIFIVILLVSTLTMFCRLSHMEPTLQPYLVLQPWCRCVDSSHTSLESLLPTSTDPFTEHYRTDSHLTPTPHSDGTMS